MFFKRLAAIFVVTASLWAGVFGFASAHVLKTDGSIGAVMHIDPDDDPLAGIPATFFFELKDKEGKFKSQDCDCKATIFLGDQQLYQASPFQNSGGQNIDAPVFSFTFPKLAVYRVELSGKPLNSGEFQDFNLKYDVRVDRQAGSAAPVASGSSADSTHLFHYALFGGAFLVILILYLKERNKAKNNKKSKTPKGIIMPLLAALALTGFFVHGSMLDTALCFHDHPVMQDHQCCVTPHMNTVADVSLQTEIVSFKVEPVNFQIEFKEFSLKENNKSPPVV